MANTGFTKDDVLARKSATDKNESLLEPENKGFTSLDSYKTDIFRGPIY